MQHHFHILVSFATIILRAKAQDLSGLPTCAEAPAISSFSSTGCDLTDLACICKDSTFIESLTPAIEKDCSSADIQKVSNFAMQLCDSVGVTLSLAGIVSTAQPTINPATASTTPASITNVATASTSAGGSAFPTNVAAISSPVASVSSIGSPSTSSPTNSSAGNATTTFSGSGSAAFDWRLVNIKLSLCIVSVMWLSAL